MDRIKEKYNQVVIPALKEKFGYRNSLAVPKINKAIINIGIGKTRADQKFVDLIENNLKRISGQKPVYTLSKKSISAFKVRLGEKVGLKVTLRGQKLNHLIDKLINVTFPRVRDFQGLDAIKSIDQHGNLNIGFKEQIVFPEIKSDEVERLHGLEIAIVTNAESWEEGYWLFKYLGFPFKELKNEKK